MKLSAGTIGTVLFTIAGLAVFVLMAKRPAMEGSAMNFGMPLSKTSTEEKTSPEADQSNESLTTNTAITPPTTAESMPATPEADSTQTEKLKANIEETLNENKSSGTPSTESILDETTPTN